MNTIQLTGRLVADPIFKQLDDNKHVTELRLAVEGMGRGGRNEAGYVNVASWDMTQRAADTLGKGWLVAVEGRLQHDIYEKDGAKRSAYSVIGHVDFLARPRNSSDSDQDGAEDQAADDSDDIPF